MFNGFMKGIKFITAVLTPNFLMFIGAIAVGLLILYGFIFTCFQVEATTYRSFKRLNKFIGKNKLASKENFNNLTASFQKKGGKFLFKQWEEVVAGGFLNYRDKFNREIIVSSRTAAKTYKVRRAIISFMTILVGLVGGVSVFANAPSDMPINEVLLQAAAISFTFILAGIFINLIFNAMGRSDFNKLIEEFDTFNHLVFAGVKVAYDTDLSAMGGVKFEMAEDRRLYKQQVETLAKRLNELESTNKAEEARLKAEYDATIDNIRKASEEKIKQISTQPDAHITAASSEIDVQRLEANVRNKENEITKLQGQVSAQDESIKTAFKKIQELQIENEKLAARAGKKGADTPIAEMAVLSPAVENPAKQIFGDSSAVVIEDDDVKVVVTNETTSPSMADTPVSKPVVPKPLPRKANEQEINAALADLLAAMEKYQNKKVRQD